LISVNNYLMFNTVHYGSAQDSFKGGYPGSSTAVLRDRLARPPMYFPATQIFELSDGIPDNNKVVKAHSTQKSVLETTIKDFVDTAREQDRILVFFAGHATHLEKESYLVPIDGNMKKPESLLPLKWVYEQLAKCRAQQKVLVLDLFRFSPSRGFELPSTGDGAEGAMPEDFDKDLQNPPAGVQVLCSCQKEQSSVELDGGSAFMQAFCHSLQGGAEMAGIAGPTQPIPVDVLVVKINQRLKDLLAGEKVDGKPRTQVARLTGSAGTPMGYEAKEALAPLITLKPPTVPGGNVAGAAQVNNILDELRILPAVRDTRAGDANLLRAQNLPAFSKEKLDGYKNDGYQNLTDLENRYKANNDAYAKEFPLRAAYFEALAALQESQKVKMRETLQSPINPKQKAAFLLEQEPLGISIFKLQQALRAVRDADKMREMETSKRWQANFDYVQARLQSRLVYLFEYNYTLGQIRADNLPELAPGQSGWRVGVSGAKLNVTENDAKDLAKKTKKLWDKIEESYPDTPWSLLAQRESKIALGLTWKAKSD
jgi:Caspase domain